MLWVNNAPGFALEWNASQIWRQLGVTGASWHRCIIGYKVHLALNNDPVKAITVSNAAGHASEILV